jgi:hypothetical protein
MSCTTLFRGLGAAFVIGLGLAQAAAAETQDRAPAPAASPVRLNLRSLSSPYDPGQRMKEAGIARTSIDHRSDDGSAAASLGFLCGLQPTPKVYGGAGALGVNREGRFLGGQLRFGFR